MTESTPQIKPDRLKKLLRRLVDIYSPSGKEEEVLEYVGEFLRRHGISFREQPVSAQRYNLIVMPGDRDPELALVGHLDTVTAHDLLHYGYQDKDDTVTGLGSADMKGGCAAMIEAFVSLWESGHRDLPVALALVVGEEEEGDGAQTLVKELDFPRAVIGEPTDLRPCLRHFGYMETQVLIAGERVHASMAKRIEKPIEGMLHLLLKLSNYFNETWSEAIFNIRELSTSRAGFAVPEECEAWLDVHLPPSSPLGDIMSEIEDIFRDESRTRFSSLTGRLRFTLIHSGYDLPEKGTLVDAIKQVYRGQNLPWEPGTFCSHSDANVLWAAGVKPVLLGPGQLEQAHTRNESVAFSQVEQAARIYAGLLKTFDA